jgi:hypothetical protein
LKKVKFESITCWWTINYTSQSNIGENAKERDANYLFAGKVSKCADLYKY